MCSLQRCRYGRIPPVGHLRPSSRPVSGGRASGRLDGLWRPRAGALFRRPRPTIHRAADDDLAAKRPRYPGGRKERVLCRQGSSVGGPQADDGIAPRGSAETVAAHPAREVCLRREASGSARSQHALAAVHDLARPVLAPAERGKSRAGQHQAPIRRGCAGASGVAGEDGGLEGRCPSRPCGLRRSAGQRPSPLRSPSTR